MCPARKLFCAHIEIEIHICKREIGIDNRKALRGIAADGKIEYLFAAEGVVRAVEVHYYVAVERIGKVSGAHIGVPHHHDLAQPVHDTVYPADSINKQLPQGGKALFGGKAAAFGAFIPMRGIGRDGGHIVFVRADMDDIIREDRGDFGKHLADDGKGLFLPDTDGKHIFLRIARAGDPGAFCKRCRMGEYFDKRRDGNAERSGVSDHPVDLFARVFQVFAAVAGEIRQAFKRDRAAVVLHKMELQHVHAGKRHFADMAHQVLHGHPRAAGAFQHHGAVGGIRPILDHPAGQREPAGNGGSKLGCHRGGIARAGVVAAVDLHAGVGDTHQAIFALRRKGV